MRVDSIMTAARRDPAVLLASIGANMLSLVVPLSMIHLYDRIIPTQGYETLTVLGIVVAGAILGEVVIRAARSMILEHAGEKFELVAYNAAIDTLLNADPRSVENSTRGRLQRNISAIEKLRELQTGPTALAILDLPFAILFLGVILVISPPSGAVLFAILLLTFALLRWARRKSQLLHNERKDFEERRYSFVREALSGIEVIKGLHIERAMCRRYERLMSGTSELGAKNTKNIHAAQGFAATVGAFTPVVVAGMGAFLVIDGSMTVGALAAVILLSGRIIQPTLRVEAFLAGVAASGQEREDLESILCLPRLADGKQDLRHVDRLSLANVATDATSQNGFAFHAVSLSLQRGDCVAITGPSRRACSAFLRLLVGETPISSGTYTMNGDAIENLRLADRHRHVRLASRRNQLLTGTILENMTGFQTTARRDQAIILASRLGLDDTLAKSPEGYELVVGSGGKVTLNTSLADTIGIIGVLSSKPDVLLFDEANATLDRSTDEKLLHILASERAERITVIYSSRPSYQRLATRTIDITPFITSTQIHSRPNEAVA